MQVAADPEHGWRLEGVFEVTAGARAGGPGPRGHGQVAGGRYVYVTPAGFAAWHGLEGPGWYGWPRRSLLQPLPHRETELLEFRLDFRAPQAFSTANR
jgi:hypothetical protein